MLWLIKCTYVATYKGHAATIIAIFTNVHFDLEMWFFEVPRDSLCFNGSWKFGIFPKGLGKNFYLLQICLGEVYFTRSIGSGRWCLAYGPTITEARRDNWIATKPIGKSGTQIKVGKSSEVEIAWSETVPFPIKNNSLSYNCGLVLDNRYRLKKKVMWNYLQNSNLDHLTGKNNKIYF